MRTTKNTAPGIQKIRRDMTGGKRGDGWRLQREGRRVRRPDSGRIAIGPVDPTLSNAAGLIPFGTYLRRRGVDRQLERRFGRLKTGARVVYPMGCQMRLLIDTTVLDEPRVFGLEGLARDPVFTYLAGGTVCSIDTGYRDLARFDQRAITDLEEITAQYGFWDNVLAQHSTVHLDIDTTVESLFGHQEGAKPGPNPRYHGRPSYHPILACIAETRTVGGAQLRHGDTGFGAADADCVAKIVSRTRCHVHANQRLVTRIDAAGDCVEILRAIEDKGSLFIVRARLTNNLTTAIFDTKRWQTVTETDEGKPARQVADITFARKEWQATGRNYRVVAVRTLDTESTSGKQIYLWPELEYVVKAYVTNDLSSNADAIAREYEDRAGVEPLIGEFKHALGLGAVPTATFDANHAMFLLKLLTHNLVRSFVSDHAPDLITWRTPWLRRAIFAVPCTLKRTGNRRYVRFAPASPLFNLRC